MASVDVVSGNCQDCGDTDCLLLSSIDSRLRQLIEIWPELADEVREEVETLCHRQP